MDLEMVGHVPVMPVIDLGGVDPKKVLGGVGSWGSVNLGFGSGISRLDRVRS